MILERTTNEVILRLPASVDVEELQDLINFARYKELVSGFKVSQSVVDEIADEISSSWWNNNRESLTK